MKNPDDKNCLKFLKQSWQESGLNSGDTVLLHSSLKRTFNLLIDKGYRPSGELILESLLDTLGNNGTLILPLFNFDFTKGIEFSFNETKSRMGILTEIARKHKDAVRTGHPIYSFCAIGKYSYLFKDLDNYSAFGSDSPFAILRKIDGKIGVIDLMENDAVTFHHHVEEMMNVDFRYHKKFSGWYTDKRGNKTYKTYSFFVRDLEAGVERNLNVIGEKLTAENIYNGSAPGVGNGFRLASANKIFDFVKKIILSGKAYNNLYIIKKNKDEFSK